MQNAEELTPERISEFLKGSRELEFAGQSRAEIYEWTGGTLVAQEYHQAGQATAGADPGVLGQSDGTESAADHAADSSVYGDGKSPGASVEPAALRGEVYRGGCAAAGRSGPCPRAAERASHAADSGTGVRGVRQAGVCGAGRDLGIHLYNLRQSASYRRVAAVFEGTRPSGVSIAERRRPNPEGRPGFLRVDTVHQGDWEGAKGVYHINAVDTVTQWQVVGCASKISERFLLPVLEAMLHQFPFRILGFHSDNGSEFINHKVAELLEKLRAEFTKSRACRSQDNALVEGKNGAVIRKHIGYGHIGGEHAEALQKFYTAHLNPYLNYHRPCGFATLSFDGRGKRKRRYRAEDYATPYEKLKSLPKAEQWLKPGIGFERLDSLAARMSDTECARKLSAAKSQLLRRCKSESPIPPRFL